MRLVVQRVVSGEVKVGGTTVGKIGKGLFVLFGVGAGDTKEDVRVLAEKLSKMRIMADDKGKMNLSVLDTHASLLIVSQFTLYADTVGGNRPSFIKAAEPSLAKELYEYFISLLKEKNIDIATGSFGEYMKINTLLDGPVTITVDSKDLKVGDNNL